MNRIETVTGFQTHYAALNDWIKCSDRLPETTMTVLCCDSTCPCAVAVGVLTELAENNFVCENEYYKLFHITHWMPLPTIPNQTLKG